MTKFKLWTLSLFVLFVSLPAYSQIMPATQSTVAYVNSDELLEEFPERKQAIDQLLILNEEYKKELELMQNEYNKKYSDYITYQASLAENIKLRRMQELTELENRMQEFMEMAQKDIEFQEKERLEPLRQRIKEAINAVGLERNYMVIYDLANSGISFVSPHAEDANPFVRQKLGIR